MPSIFKIRYEIHDNFRNYDIDDISLLQGKNKINKIN